MTIEAALYAELSDYSGLTDLVSDKIYPDCADQKARLPYVVFERISATPEHVCGGLPTMTTERFQFTAFASTARVAKAIRTQVIGCLRGFTGLMGGASGVTISACLDQGGPDTYEGDPRVFEAPIDFMISHDAV